MTKTKRKKVTVEKHNPIQKGHVHKSHGEAVNRLKRANGHINSVIKMIEDHKSCPDILQQLTAVISALGSCRLLLLQDHMNSCIKPALKPGSEDLLKEIEIILQRVVKV